MRYSLELEKLSIFSDPDKIIKAGIEAGSRLNLGIFQIASFTGLEPRQVKEYSHPCTFDPDYAARGAALLNQIINNPSSAQRELRRPSSLRKDIKALILRPQQTEAEASLAVSSLFDKFLGEVPPEANFLFLGSKSGCELLHARLKAPEGHIGSVVPEINRSLVEAALAVEAKLIEEDPNQISIKEIERRLRYTPNFVIFRQPDTLRSKKWLETILQWAEKMQGINGQILITTPSVLERGVLSSNLLKENVFFRKGRFDADVELRSFGENVYVLLIP